MPTFWRLLPGLNPVGAQGVTVGWTQAEVSSSSPCKRRYTVNNIPVELARRRKIRERNPVGHRLAHWPIWIWVCYITPGPLTFDLFARGFDLRMAAWLGVVLAATGVAGLRGRLPGVEPRPYIIRFTEDKPNPVYRAETRPATAGATETAGRGSRRRPLPSRAAAPPRTDTAPPRGRSSETPASADNTSRHSAR